MTDIAQRVWVAYHLGDTQADHPLRLLVEENRALRAERDHILSIARENGQQRDAARQRAAALRADMLRRAEALEAGYQGGVCLVDRAEIAITLHYEKPQQAEQAFAVISDLIDSRRGRAE